MMTLIRFLCCSTAVVMMAAPAAAQGVAFDIPAQPAATAIAAFARQARVQIVVSGKVASGRRVNTLRGQFAIPEALDRLLAGTGLVAKASGSGAWVVVADRAVPKQAAPSAPATISAAADDNAASADIVVTAQRTAEPLAKVPSSVVALSRGRMDQMGVRDFADIAQLTPGVRLRPEIN